MDDMKHKLKSKFDQQENYHQILTKATKKKALKRFRYSFASIGLVAALAILFINLTPKNELPVLPSENEIFINNSTKENELAEFLLSDIDIKMIEGIDKNNVICDVLQHINFFDNLQFPNDLITTKTSLIYTREENATTYDILHDYLIEYTSENDRSLILSISKDYLPLRDNFLDTEPLKTSTIHNNKLKIVGNGKTYIATFHYKGLNFDVETINLSEKELVVILESILK